MSENVRVTRDGGIWEIVLDRPKANAISIAVSRELSGVFCSFRDDPDARIAILTGGGERFFSAGWDLKAAAAGEEDTAASSLIDGGFAGLTELWSLDKPVIAAVNGMAAGGGFELALAADMIVASENAECWLPEAQIGILPDGGGVVRLDLDGGAEVLDGPPVPVQVHVGDAPVAADGGVSGSRSMTLV